MDDVEFARCNPAPHGCGQSREVQHDDTMTGSSASGLEGETCEERFICFSSLPPSRPSVSKFNQTHGFPFSQRHVSIKLIIDHRA